MVSMAAVLPSTSHSNMSWHPNEARSALIVTRTPLRVSFAGGGTDLAAFYEHEYGAVLSTAIDKYVYVTLKRHDHLFDSPIRINYSETEQVNRVDDIKNDIARECLRFLEVDPPIYLSTVADVPAATGLGSSSAFAVGLLNALHLYRGERVSAGQLAEEAAHVEIDILNRPIGKQDHYAAAFGGLNFFRFVGTGDVAVEPQRCANGGLRRLFAHIMMFWTGLSRDAGSVLSEQKGGTRQKMRELVRMRENAHACQLLLRDGFHAEALGGLLHDSWQLKRQLATRISNPQIDQWYQIAMDAGAAGGKLCGAGGGGFLLFIVPVECQGRVRQALGELEEISIGYEPLGSRVLMPNIE